MNTPHVQVILDQNTVPGPLRTALNRVKARVSLRSMEKAYENGISPTADVCVILPQKRGTPDVLGRILADANDRACATMVLPGLDDFPEAMAATDSTIRRLATGAEDASAMNADELTGRIRALCEIRSPFRQMRAELDQLRQRDAERQQGSRQLDEQLRLASEIQRDLLPGPLPETGPLSIEALYVAADYVSGDIYDVCRLDENHLGLSIADATGHGLPAALLTIFIKNCFRGKEINGDTYRLLEPDEILARLNAEMMNTRLSQCQFITGLHAIFDRRSNRIRWSRGGVPYPIFIRAGQPARRMLSTGTLVGAFESPRFEVVEQELEPGDTLLFFTDGLEALLARHDPAFTKGDIEDSRWVRRLIEDGIPDAIEEIRRLTNTTPESEWQKDDVTLLAVQMGV